MAFSIEARTVGVGFSPETTASSRGFSNDALGVGPQNALAVDDMLIMVTAQNGLNVDGSPLVIPTVSASSEPWTHLVSSNSDDGHQRIDLWYLQLASAYADGTWTTTMDYSPNSRGSIQCIAIRGFDPGEAATAILQTVERQVNSQHDDLTVTMASALTVGTSQTPDANWNNATDGSLFFLAAQSHSSVVGATATYIDQAYNHDGFIGGGGGTACFGGGASNQCIANFALGWAYGHASGTSSIGVSPFRFSASAQCDITAIGFEVRPHIAGPADAEASGLLYKKRHLAAKALPHMINTGLVRKL